MELRVVSIYVRLSQPSERANDDPPPRAVRDSSRPDVRPMGYDQRRASHKKRERERKKNVFLFRFEKKKKKKKEIKEMK